MSGLWFLFVLVVWGGVSWLFWQPACAYLADGAAPRLLRITVIALVASLWLGVSFWYAGGRKIYYDVEVNRLCRVDGGVKVYETVKLPAEKFDKWGQINFYKPTQGENTLGTEYVYRSTNFSIRQNNPDLRRDHVQIFRKSDMKLLGEVTTYVRGGGDLPGPWQPTAYRCPDGSNANGVVLMNKVFTNLEE